LLTCRKQTPLIFDKNLYCFQTDIENAYAANAQEPLEPESIHVVDVATRSSYGHLHQPTLLRPEVPHGLDMDAERMVDSLVDVKSDNDNITTPQRFNIVAGNALSLRPDDSTTFSYPTAVHDGITHALPSHSLSNQEVISISPRNQYMDHSGSGQTSRGDSPVVSRQMLTMDWNMGFQQGPSTSKQLNQFPRLRSASRFSPLAPPGLSGHTRNMSTGSAQSARSCNSNSIWTPEEACDGQPAGERQLGITGLMHLGNGSFGTLDEPFNDSGMGNSLLFGAGMSPWNMNARDSRKMSESPRMASIWDSPSGMRHTPGRPIS